ncbi:glycosyltransferase family 4 protein [bacterium]|nr:glycosyltransferase family 4 protein [bacterium]
MKKILIYSIAYHPFVGGAEVAIKEITDRLPDYEYHMITNKFDAQWQNIEKIGNITVHRIGQGKKWDKYLYPFRSVFFAAKLHKEIKFDFAWSMMAFYAGLAALLFKYKTKVPYLLTLQSGDSDSFLKKRTWFWEYFYKQIYRQPKITQVISKFLGKRSRKMGNKGEVVLVSNGVDLDIFKMALSEEDKKNIRQELNVADDEIIITTTSRLALKNGIDDLIKSMNHLIFKLGVKAKLVIFGGGPDEQKLKNLAKSQRVQDKVLFMGYMDYKKLPKYVEAADIFCRPSLSEGFGNSFVESMAVGTPIIATEVGGIPDFLFDGKTGLFCKVRDYVSIAEAAAKYVKDKNLYNKVAKQGKELALEKYSWNTIAKKMNIIFQERM